MKMKEKIVEIIKYGFWGCVSSGINLVLFYLFIYLDMQYLCANVISYIIAIIFSYFFNLFFVFNNDRSDKAKKGIKYVAMRGGSLLADSVLLWFLYKVCKIDIVWVKIVDSVIIIVGTFIFSKLFIFTEDKGKKN
mgnify:CR=1 FL=1